MAKEEVKIELDLDEIWAKAKKRAFGGGIAGASAMGVQVCTMMWLRTTMNFQYRYGMTTRQALSHLYNDGGRGFGGIRRFYRGVGPALAQGPLSRFGDTAANTGMLTLLNAHPKTKDWHVTFKSLAASSVASIWRIFLMPIDATKSTLQVEGKEGFKKLCSKVKTSGPTVLWHGGLAAAGATFVGHFPWFGTYNYLSAKLPKADPDSMAQKLARRAGIGFVSSVISDTCSNSIRVCKTFKQTSTVAVTYPQVVRQVIEKDGVIGLFGRGLKTRILANGLQGLVFSVLWKYFEDLLNKE